MRIAHYIISLFLILLLTYCRKTEELSDFTEEDEIALGEKLAEIIRQDPSFSVISATNNSVPYNYVNTRLSEITNSSIISKSENFNWEVILLDDESRRAFATPGGYIYMTSGLIFFLDDEDQFSGLLAQMVAHIVQSHITETLFFKYGVNTLRSIARSGNEESLREIISDLDLSSDDFLSISRSSQIKADTLGVSLLSQTGQSCESNSLTFSRILNVQPDQQARLIAAYGINASRIEDIQEYALLVGCDTQVDSESVARFRSFRNSLP
ncbi:MAG: M48 family metalloprotease [Bacteroidota bacterium]